MGFKCGIVGLPNVGKSTLFNALTKSKIEVANYPFCTIDPNIGIVPIDDERQYKINEIIKPKSNILTTMEFVDIAGLVAGASKGEGLGNKFLSHIREVDAIVHVVRCFDDENITHVSNSVNPVRDVDIIKTELLLADLASVEKQIQKTSKIAKSGDKDAKKKLDILLKIEKELNDGKTIKQLDLSDDDKEQIKDLHTLTIKPTMYIANVSEDVFENNPYLNELQKIADVENAALVPICASIEEDLAEMSKDEQKEFLSDLGLNEVGLNRVIKNGYKLLGLQTYFTAGEKEVRAWTIPIGANAPQAAGKIHTDFEKGFIRAEVISYQDFIDCNGEQNAKEKGKLRVEGKDYIVQDGDVIHFRFNV